MLRTFFIAVLCLSLSILGCFVPRNLLPLSRNYWPQKTTAILPFKMADNPYYDITHEIPTEKITRVVNAVLNTLATWTNKKLMGPDILISAFKNDPDLERITVSLNNYGRLGENSVAEASSSFSRKIGVENIVLIHVDVVQYQKSLSDIPSDISYVGQGWAGTVRVKAELINLVPATIVKRSAGEAEFWGKKGVNISIGVFGVLPVPFIYGKTFGRAVDQAAREALSQLFKK